MYPRLQRAGVAAAAAASATLLAAGMSGAAASAASGHGTVGHRPAAAAAATAARYPVQGLTQEFATNTQPFCPAGSGNLPCSGAAGDYGTIDRVLSGFSNGGYGNYSPDTKALTGDWFAVVSGTGDGNQGTGCPGTTATSNPGETCSGPFALFGSGKGQGRENVFPKDGFTVTDDLYLSPTTAGPAGSLVDDDVELNNSAGAYGIDNVITACAEDTASSTMGFVISFGNASPGSCEGTPKITTDGWYRFVFAFTDQHGIADLAESVRSEATGKVVAHSGLRPVGGTPSGRSKWGGPGFLWLPTEDFAGLPLANVAVQLGNVPAGHRA
jgi:hypothetical protein